MEPVNGRLTKDERGKLTSDINWQVVLKKNGVQQTRVRGWLGVH
jgi:hypothetical protein